MNGVGDSRLHFAGRVAVYVVVTTILVFVDRTLRLRYGMNSVLSWFSALAVAFVVLEAFKTLLYFAFRLKFDRD